MNRLDQRRTDLLAELGALPDAAARLEYLVDLAQETPPWPDAERRPESEIEGCLARLWFAADWRDGRCHFRCDSDSLVVKSIAALLCRFYSDATPAEIVALEPTFLREAGITAHLTPNRRNALTRVWSRIRSFASQVV